MYFTLLIAVSYLVGAVLSVVLWKQNEDDDLLWCIWLGAIGCVAETTDLILRLCFQPPSSVLFISASLRLLFGVVAITTLLWIGLKMLIRQKNK
jgi:hypothetical protein